MSGAGGVGGGSGIGACGSVKVEVAFVPLPPPAGVALYSHVDSGGGKSLACVSSAGAASSSEFIGTIRGMREGDRVSPQEHGDISD